MKGSYQAEKEAMFRTGENVAILVFVSNLLLVLFKYTLATFSGSRALLADALHSLTDVINTGGIYIGLKVSKRKSRQFPYGLYKVENLAALVTSVLILLAGYEILTEILRGNAVRPLRNLPFAIAGVSVTIVWNYAIARYELNTGRRLNSPSLIADGRHVFADLLSTIVILLSLLGSLLGFHLDAVAAVIVVLFITKSGIEIAIQAIRVLLDASLDFETMDKVKSILLAFPQVKAIHSLKGRNSGRFKFIESEIEIRESRLEKAHALSSRIEEEIKKQIPGVDHVLIHYEPYTKRSMLFAVPLNHDKQRMSPHFGEAPYFAIIEVEPGSHRIRSEKIVKNPHAHLEKAKGIAVAEWLVNQGVDAVITAKRFEHRGPAYVFGDAGVNLFYEKPKTLAEIKEMILSGKFGAQGENGQDA